VPEEADMRILAAAALATLALSACDLVQDAEQQKAAQKKAAESTELRDHIQQPIDRAKAAGDPIKEADEAREKALKDQGG
jgi:uncharacterized lipoprotein